MNAALEIGSTVSSISFFMTLPNAGLFETLSGLRSHGKVQQKRHSKKRDGHGNIELEGGTDKEMQI